MEMNDIPDSSHGRIASSFDGFIDEDGIREEAQALKELLAWQIEQGMEAAHLNRTAMARRMATSRAKLERLLDPTYTSITIHALQRAAAEVSRLPRSELV